MSSEKTEPAEGKPKKGKGLVMKLVMGLVLIGAGGGGAYGLVAAGVIGGGGKHEKEDNTPKLIRKGEEDPYAPKAEGKEGEGVPEVEGEGGSKYRTAYYSFSDEFTSNLKDSDGLIQLSLAASTRRDGRVLMWLKKHELAIRSDMLAVMADTPEEDVTTLQGKQRLQKRLTAAINHVLEQTEGFGGVDDVYFKNFIVQ
jgi:flagellar FliL protein